MYCGFKSNRVAVAGNQLIERLDICTPFSTTNGDIRFEEKLMAKEYLGLYLIGKPNNRSSQEHGDYQFQLRGSLSKVANNGLHNYTPISPYAVLKSVDTIAVKTRIDVNRTPIHNLEVSTTIRAEAPELIRNSIVSYLNERPNFSTIDRDGYKLPYAEVKASQHKFKLYSPMFGALRIELHTSTMQYLGKNAPKLLSDLVKPQFIPPMATKLLTAFDKVVWSCPSLDVNVLPYEDKLLYLLGKEYSYWQVDANRFQTKKEFRRIAKQREREFEHYKVLVEHYWEGETIAALRQRIKDQLDLYTEIMNTPLYQSWLEICQERWHTVVNLSPNQRLPKRLELPKMSEIYPLYFARFATIPMLPAVKQTSYPTKRWLSAKDLQGQPDVTAELMKGYKPRASHTNQPAKTDEEIAWQRQRNQYSSAPNNLLKRMKKELSANRKLLWSLDELEPMLSAKAKTALAYANKSLGDLVVKQPNLPPLPLFDRI